MLITVLLGVWAISGIEPKPGLTYLALGDSYTIGESVMAEEKYPVQLAHALRNRGLKVEDPQIIATTGWTTAELLTGIKSADPKGPYDLVTLLIGVNNQYRNDALDNYKTEFLELLRQSISFAGGKASRVIVISIPDYGVTPFTKGSDRLKIGSEIDGYNLAAENICKAQSVAFVNVTAESREAAKSPALIAADGLHPSGAMYKAWTDLIWPTAERALRG